MSKQSVWEKVADWKTELEISYVDKISVDVNLSDLQHIMQAFADSDDTELFNKEQRQEENHKQEIKRIVEGLTTNFNTEIDELRVYLNETERELSKVQGFFEGYRQSIKDILLIEKEM